MSEKTENKQKGHFQFNTTLKPYKQINMKTMKTKTFREKYEIDRTKNGLNAIEKIKVQARKKPTVWLTANGRVYDPTQRYYFFDVQGKEIRPSGGLRLDEKRGCLDSFGLRINDPRCPVFRQRL